MKVRKVLPLIAVLLFASFACGDNDEDTTESPAVTDTADVVDDGTGGTTQDGSPGPVESPDATPTGTADGPDTGGGAIYDETPSVEPPGT